MSSNSPAPPLPLLLLTCALLCAGCSRAGDRAPMKIVKEARHANGLTVGVPEGFEAKPTEDGFVVEPSGDANRRVRDPVMVYVSLFKGIPRDDYGLRSKSVGGKEVLYSLTKGEGGSGGETYTISVEQGVPGGYVKYVQAIQSKDGEPDFALFWTLVGSTKYQQKNN